ncbi:MAG: LysM peptidoglycan-binding domain-containing protein [Blautia sp.]|nr:LysM peptidoglycan-binding domain-containing protein [Blautia sp.]
MEARFQNVKITGTDYITWKITDREWKRDRRIQRLRKVRRQRCLTVGLALAVIACIILICAVSYSAIKVRANTGFKYYAGITVESGETLWSIADRYMDYEYYADKDAYMAEIVNINHLEDRETLLTGQFLVVPYYSMEYVQ